MSSPILDRELVTEKLNSAIRLIDRLLGDKFPYSDSDDALKKILDHFIGILKEISELDPDTEHSTILKYCTRANQEIELYKSFLGLILRSSNVRNAFEIYMPLRSIGEKLLGPDIRIVISSEWDFIPFIYPELTPELKEFIFVGLPASESQNALLIPIAGHELGHAVWRRKAIDQRFARLISAKLVSRFKTDFQLLERYFPEGAKAEDVEKHKDTLIWKYCYNFASRQAEEIFCDFVGLWLFGLALLWQIFLAAGIPKSVFR